MNRCPRTISSERSERELLRHPPRGSWRRSGRAAQGSVVSGGPPATASITWARSPPFAVRGALPPWAEMRCGGCGAANPRCGPYCIGCGAELSGQNTVFERRQVSIVVADLVGFTLLPDHLVGFTS